MMARKKDPIDLAFKSYIQNKYSVIPKDDLEKTLNSIMVLAEMSRDRKNSLRSILEHAARMVFRLFEFDEIAIGLKNPKDGKFRYEIVFGFTKNAEIAYRKVEYTLEDMGSYDKYPFMKIGRLSELDVAEGFSEDDKGFYDRPLALGAPRASHEDFIEGDYFDIWMYGDQGDLIGWFELSKPRNGKMPPCSSIRWIEVIVDVCALIVQRRFALEGA